jgi:hypothetical protein
MNTHFARYADDVREFVKAMKTWQDASIQAGSLQEQGVIKTAWLVMDAHQKVMNVIHELGINEVAWIVETWARFQAIMSRTGMELSIKGGKWSATNAPGFTHFVAVAAEDVDLVVLERLQAAGPERLRLILGLRSEQPRIGGHVKKRLTRAKYDVLDALKKAGEKGLSLHELRAKSGHSDCRAILRRLREDPDWAAVIQMAEGPGGRYRVLT